MQINNKSVDFEDEKLGKTVLSREQVRIIEAGKALNVDVIQSINMQKENK